MNRFHAIATAVALVLAALLASWFATGRDGEDSPFVADPADCIVGLDQPRRLTRPARIDYPLVLEQTPQLRELRRKRIPPDSARGIVLRSEGAAFVAETCAVVMGKLGYDSVWKRISRKDGAAIPDITEYVLVLIDPETETESDDGMGGRIER